MPRRHTRTPSPASSDGRGDEGERQHYGQEIPERHRARKIKVFRNGDKFDKGRDYTISQEKWPKFDAFLDHLAKGLDVRWPIQKLYTIDGEEVNDMDDLEGDGVYVAAQSVFFPMDYGSTDRPQFDNSARLKLPSLEEAEAAKSPRGSEKEGKKELRRSKSYDSSPRHHKKKSSSKDKESKSHKSHGKGKSHHRSSRYAD